MCPKKRMPGQAGVTLIELLIAVTIVSFIGVVIYSTFYQGTKLWQRARSIQPDVDGGILFEKIERDLRSSYDAPEEVFQGSGQELKAATLSSRVNIAPGAPMPIRVRYRYDEDTGSLMRSEESLLEILSPDRKGTELTYHPVVKGLKKFRLEYYHLDTVTKSFQWKPFWRASCRPAAVRISAQFDDNKKKSPIVRVMGVPGGGCP